MTATLTIFREDNRGENRPILVNVSLDRDGDLCATCAEDVEERRSLNRYGSVEEYSTGRYLFEEGDIMELNDDELLEAEQALAQLQKLWDEERARLRDIFRPATTTLNPPAPSTEEHPSHGRDS